MKPRPPIPDGPHLVVGLARSGVAAALALRARGEEVIGLDAGDPPAAAELAAAGVQLHLGEPSGARLLDRAGSVIKSPGVPSEAPVILAARRREMPVLGELELAWRLLANEFIAVTGTNGKTTTVELIGHVHRQAGLPVAVAGNVGTALSSLAGSLDPGVTVVCEASSFQLEDTLCFAPEAAVLLNLSADHLDRHGTFDAYRAAKLEIFSRQDESDVAVVPTSMLPLDSGAGRLLAFGTGSAAALSESDGQLHWHGQPLLALSEIRLHGGHNVQNAMAAAAVCLARGIDSDAVRDGLRSFKGVAHRLEDVGSRGGVLFVNDSKATNVASTLVALDAFAGGPVHLILGGQGKSQDFTALRAPIEQCCRAVYLIGQDAPAIAAALAGADVPVHRSDGLEEALAAAVDGAEPGDVILLSPASASFDQYIDFEARGEHFRALVEKMQA